MSKDRFDKKIKEKIDQQLGNKKPSDWNDFERMLDKYERNNPVDDESFDEIIKSKLNNHNTSTRNTYWESIREVLIVNHKKRVAVLRSKALELVAMLLIFITINNMIIKSPYIFHTKSFPNYYINQHSNEFVSAIPLDKAFHNSIQCTNHNNSNQLNKFSSKTKSDAYTTINSIERHNSPDIAAIENGNQSMLICPISSVEKENGLPTSPIITKNESSTNTTDIQRDNNNYTIELIPTISPDVYSEYLVSMPMKFSHPKSNVNTFISVFASADGNLINTPFDKVYSLASYDLEAINYSYGAKIGWKKERVEFETGLAYSNKAYSPNKFTESYGASSDIYFEKSLDKIDFDIVAIPFDVKYYAINSKGWGVYGNVGFVANLIMNAEYETPTTLIEGRPEPGRFVPTAPRINEKPFNKGLIHGEALKDNYFVSVGLGIGVNKSITKDVSLYVQPSYHHQILNSDIGIGPNKDKIHTTSIQAGLRMKI